MAKTAFETNDSLTKKAWEEKLTRDSVKLSYFHHFMGEGSDNIVQVDTRLTKEQGDQITIGLRKRLSGAGVTSTVALEGNEEALSLFSHPVVLEEYAHAVRDRGPLDRQRVAFSIDDESELALKDWMAEKIDQLCFDAIFGAPTQLVYREDSAGTLTYGTSLSAAVADIAVANSQINLDIITYARMIAKTGNSRAFIPIRPIMIGGKAYYVLLVSPQVLMDLKQDSGYQQAAREADVRGNENRLFEGSAAIYDGVVIHEHENVPVFSNGGPGGAVAGSQGILMGAQALCWAWGRRPEVTAESFDYGRQHGYAISMISRASKPVYDSLDYGSLGLVFARTV